MTTATHDLRPVETDAARVWDVAARVPDPEIPVLSIADLGILRAARVEADGTAVVVITPTYSGCPAMGTITEEGRRRLQEYGIAPPSGQAAVRQGPVRMGLSVKCPRCHSLNTQELTRFGSTACKALYSCRDCLEPFDYFKIH